MALDNFKKIEDRKGYLVEDDDRKIFEKEIGKSYFGLGTADMIEFILYDSSDNPLPQGDSGRLVRYININDEESKKYFLVSKNEFTKKANDAPELVFDLEQLIRDAGYNNGIFKTQVTLLNRRAGKEEIDNDKLWIHEISPSRTEIRLLPIKNTGEPIDDLIKRYETFTNEKEFRDDTIYFIQVYLESIDIQRIFERFLRTKGSVASGEQYINLIKKEFKIESVEEFFTIIKNKLTEAMLNFANGRNYHITDVNYGKPQQNIDLIELSVEQIKRTTTEVLIEVIDYYLPKRNILEKNILTPEQQITFDKVKNILKTVTSGNIYDPSIPNEVDGQVRGCTDSDALNYNPAAEIDDGTCVFDEEPTPPPIKRRGCTNSNALNYDEYATEDDGSCRFPEEPTNGGGDDEEEEVQQVETCQDQTAKNFGQVGKCQYYPQTVTKTWYVWSNTSDVSWKLKEQPNGNSYVEYDSFTITYDEQSLSYTGDIREVPKARPPQIEARQYVIKNMTHRTYLQQGNNPTPDPFDPNPQFPIPGTPAGSPLQVTYQDKSGATKQSSTIFPNDYITICAKKGSVVPMEGLRIIEQGSCGTNYPPPPLDELGCTNPAAKNYNPNATIDDGTCIPVIRGCTNSRAINYNADANTDDGSCLFREPGTGGTSTPSGEGGQGQPQIGGSGRRNTGGTGRSNETGERNTTREL